MLSLFLDFAHFVESFFLKFSRSEFSWSEVSRSEFSTSEISGSEFFR